MNVYNFSEKYERLKKSAIHHSFIQIQDNKSIVIENCIEVAAFNENMIILKVPLGNIKISGLSLEVCNYSANGLKIYGKFHSIEFEEREDKK